MLRQAQYEELGARNVPRFGLAFLGERSELRKAGPSSSEAREVSKEQNVSCFCKGIIGIRSVRPLAQACGVRRSKRSAGPFRPLMAVAAHPPERMVDEGPKPMPPRA